jgi:hypothetical protein
LKCAIEASGSGYSTGKNSVPTVTVTARACLAVVPIIAG